MSGVKAPWQPLAHMDFVRGRWRCPADFGLLTQFRVREWISLRQTPKTNDLFHLSDILPRHPCQMCHLSLWIEC